MKEILKKLLTPYGATGREETVAQVIIDMVKPYCDEIRTDAMGNVICIQHGEGERVMLAAHMDHIGFIVADIDEDGFLRVHNVGGINTAVSLNRHVVFENGVHGLVCKEAEPAPSAHPAINKMYIDIGASSREEAEKMVQIGDVAVYVPDFIQLAGTRAAAPAMDDRAGCAILVKLLMECRGCGKEVCAVFTTQEEVGLRGARAAAFDLDPQVGIALDVTLTGDSPALKNFAMKLGEGAAVKVMDSSVICHPGVVRKLEEAGARCGHKYQREVLSGGGTDTAAIQSTRCGVPAGAISIPCRYVHSAVEMVDIADLESAAALLNEYLRGDVLF